MPFSYLRMFRETAYTSSRIGSVSEMILNDATRDALSDPVGCRRDVVIAKLCMKMSGDVTKLVW